MDVLTDGRLELGMGAGDAQVEFAVGIPYEPPRVGWPAWPRRCVACAGERFDDLGCPCSSSG